MGPKMGPGSILSHFFLFPSKLLFRTSSDKRDQATFTYKNGKMENFSIFLDVCFFVAGN
jgi:hypothetical protein